VDPAKPRGRGSIGCCLSAAFVRSALVMVVQELGQLLTQHLIALALMTDKNGALK
jgi:hypothetical protein